MSICTDGWEIKGQTWLNERRSITNADAATQVHCMVLLSKQHLIMLLSGRYNNAEHTQLILILYQHGRWKRSKLFNRNGGLSDICFRSMGETSVNVAGNCGRQRTFDEQHFLRWLRMSTQDVIRPWQQEQSVDNYMERDVIAAVRKPLITKMKAHLRVEWCKNHRHRSAETWKKVRWSDDSSFTVFPTNGRAHVWRTSR